MPAIRLEKWSRTVQSNCIQGYVTRFWKNHHRLLLDNWNIFTLSGKELELVEEAKKFQLDIAGVSTKRCGSEIMDLDGGWKLFYLDADPSMSLKWIWEFSQRFATFWHRKIGAGHFGSAKSHRSNSVQNKICTE